MSSSDRTPIMSLPSNILERYVNPTAGELWGSLSGSGKASRCRDSRVCG